MSSGIDLAVRLGKLFEGSGVAQDWRLRKLHADVLSVLLDDDGDAGAGDDGANADESVLPATAAAARPFSSPVKHTAAVSSPVPTAQRPRVLFTATGDSDVTFRDDTMHDFGDSEGGGGAARVAANTASPLAHGLSAAALSQSLSNDDWSSGGSTDGLLTPSRSRQVSPAAAGAAPPATRGGTHGQQHRHHKGGAGPGPNPAPVASPLRAAPEGLATGGVEMHNLLLRNLLHPDRK